MILQKHDVQYYACLECGFLQTQDPYWMQEGHQAAIHREDTGVMMRNLKLSKKTAAVILGLFKPKREFLDYAGGCGIFTRLMRDMGFDFYWSDTYTPNLLAQGFERTERLKRCELVTSFESFEHFSEPMREIENMLKISDNVLFSTALLPEQIPGPQEWWYYGLSHGQHISFYGKKTLRWIAKNFGRNIYSDGAYFHLLTKKKIPNAYFNFLHKSGIYAGSLLTKLLMKSKTMTDHNQMH